MNSGKIFLQSFGLARRQWHVAAIAYFVQWCLALTLGMQVYEVLHASIGHSLEINQLLGRYDHTVLTDFLKVHGASITPLIGQLRWLMLVWLVFSVFIDAGLLYAVQEPQQNLRPVALFWKGAVAYFFPFFKISLIFLTLALVWTALIWAPIALFFEPSLQYFSSEQYAVWSVWIGLLLYLAGLFELFAWSVLSRVEKINKGASVLRSIRQGWLSYRGQRLKFMALIVGFMLLLAGITGVYWALDALIGMRAPLNILILFVVQQAFVFFRIQLRQMMYAGLSMVYSNR